MKTNVILLAVASFFITSCTQNEDDDLNKVIKNESETLTGSFELSDEPQIINFGGKTITFETIKNTESTGGNTRAIDPPNVPDEKPGLDLMGPYYSSATPFQTNTKNQKFVINGIAGIAAGVYIGDVWITSGEIQLPSEALFGTVSVPNPSGYKDWSTRETGIIWNMSTVTGNIVKLNWYFYTIVLKYNSAGAAMGYTIPLDGARVRVPYYYYKLAG